MDTVCIFFCLHTVCLCSRKYGNLKINGWFIGLSFFVSQGAGPVLKEWWMEREKGIRNNDIEILRVCVWEIEADSNESKRKRWDLEERIKTKMREKRKWRFSEESMWGKNEKPREKELCEDSSVVHPRSAAAPSSPRPSCVHSSGLSVLKPVWRRERKIWMAVGLGWLASLWVAAT